MNVLLTFIIVVQVLSALVVIALVLMQHGKGADMGAAFGSGASGSLFGATGSSNFLSKFTGIAAGIFFCATLGIALIGNKAATMNGGVMEKLPIVPPAKSGNSDPGVQEHSSSPVVTNSMADQKGKQGFDGSDGQQNQIPK